MSGDDIARLIYLGLLVVAIGSWFVVQNRQALGKTAQQMAVWVLIFMGTIAVYGLWGDVRNTVMPQQAVVSEQGQISVPRAPDGHYYLTLEINDVPVNFLVDTGATDMVLNASDAVRVGIDLEGLAYFGRAMTANGEVATARVTLDQVALGPHKDRRVSAWVNKGDLRQSLLGMGYLQRYAGLEIRNNQLILTR